MSDELMPSMAKIGRSQIDLTNSGKSTLTSVRSSCS
jgi:hypothetical protein